MSTTVETATEIRPFHIEIPDEQLDDLRRRIAQTRWPTKELVADRSQGVQLATMQELARYWATDYDWRKVEAKLNALPQFTTEIDGVDIHFIHVKSQHENALPLIMTHGWPGSVIELLETVGPLTDPTAHGGRAEDAFDLVLPSMPGYGFSGEPTEIGWDPGRIAPAWAELMHRLGYTRYVAQGGDVGAAITDAMGRLAPEGLVGIHTNLLVTGLGGARPRRRDTEEEQRGARRAAPHSGRAASATSWSRPRGRRRSATRCWTHPSLWRPGCSTTTRTATRRSPTPSSTGEPSGNLTRDHILDNITLYWLTGTGASAARSYWESGRAPGRSRPARLRRTVSLPVGFTTFPDEIFQAPRSWVEQGYPNLTYFNKAERGGHFAAWEEPELLLERGPGCIRVAPVSLFSKRHTDEAGALPFEGQLAEFDGATGWLNSSPLSPADLRGQVVLVDFWTYTCINWLRTLGYVRAWAEKYEDQGLVVVGVHTPEFPFERDVDNVREAAKEMRVEYPIALDSDYAVWQAFSNHYWPAVYIADAEGRIRHHQFGEGGYEECERIVQQLLREAGGEGISDDLVPVPDGGVRASGRFREPRDSRVLSRVRAGAELRFAGWCTSQRASRLRHARTVTPEPVGSHRRLDGRGQGVRAGRSRWTDRVSLPRARRPSCDVTRRARQIRPVPRPRRRRTSG